MRRSRIPHAVQPSFDIDSYTQAIDVLEAAGGDLDLTDLTDLTLGAQGQVEGEVSQSGHHGVKVTCWSQITCYFGVTYRKSSY